MNILDGKVYAGLGGAKDDSKQTPSCTGPKESYVYRDPWTLKPAKIMQVRSMLIDFIELWIILVLLNISVFVFYSKNMY